VPVRPRGGLTRRLPARVQQTLVRREPEPGPAPSAPRRPLRAEKTRRNAAEPVIFTKKARKHAEFVTSQAPSW